MRKYLQKLISTFTLSTFLLNINLPSIAFDRISLTEQEKEKIFNLNTNNDSNINIDNNSKVTTENKDPLLAGLYSSLIPGAGLIYLGETHKGLAYSTLLIPMLAPYYITTDNIYTSAAKHQIRNFALDLYLYNTYDTYQTALDKLDRPQRVLNITHYSPQELLLAMFDSRSYISKNGWSNAIRGFQIGFIVLIFSTVTILSLLTNRIHPNVTPIKFIGVLASSAVMSSLIGSGEESYFRGFIQPAISEITKSKLAGNIAQSVYFGLAHTRPFANIGGTSFPYGLGTIAAFTSTIDSKREYQPPSLSEQSQVSDIGYFAYTSITGFLDGLVMEFDEDDHGLLKTTATHAINDTLAITMNYLIQGDAGRTYIPIMSVSF